uniref:Uncharacterized protein n=1 Tax=Anguilla anguilla TaxID=7936 RepID=A0A0E9XDK6_ANGAN
MFTKRNDTRFFKVCFYFILFHFILFFCRYKHFPEEIKTSGSQRPIAGLFYSSLRTSVSLNAPKSTNRYETERRLEGYETVSCAVPFSKHWVNNLEGMYSSAPKTPQRGKGNY